MQPSTTESVLLRVVRWDESKAWAGEIAHTRGMLVSLLRASTPISNIGAKRLIKAAIAKQATEILLVNRSAYSSMCHALQSIGAEVEAIPWRDGAYTLAQDMSGYRSTIE